jgi:O-antigen ligase
VVLNSDSLVAQKLLVSLQRLYGSQLLQESRSLNGRTELWEIVSIAWERCLLFGFGFDGARDQILRLIPWAGQSHNGFLEFFLSTGMPGLVAFLAGWISAVRTGLSSPFGRAAVPVYCYLLIVANAGPIFTMFQCYGLFMILALHYWVRQPAPERLAIVQQAPGYSLGSALMRAS